MQTTKDLPWIIRDLLNRRPPKAIEQHGASLRHAAVLGQMDDARTVSSNYIVHPFVGLIPYPYDFKASVQEVKEIIEVPFEVFLSGDSAGESYPVVYEGATYQTLAYRYR